MGEIGIIILTAGFSFRIERPPTPFGRAFRRSHLYMARIAAGFSFIIKIVVGRTWMAKIRSIILAAAFSFRIDRPPPPMCQTLGGPILIWSELLPKSHS